MGLSLATGAGPCALLWSGPEFAVVSLHESMRGSTETAVLQLHTDQAADFLLVVSEIDLEVHALRPLRRVCRITLGEMVLSARLENGVLETRDLAGHLETYRWEGPTLRRLAEGVR